MNVERFSRANTVAALTLAVALTVGPSALAAETSAADQTRAVTQSIAVKTGDLDLSRDAGRRAAYARLEAAARRVCGGYDRRDQHARSAWKECYETALSAAVASLDSEPLAALHARATAE